MNPQVEMTVRGPQAYDLAHRAIDAMREIHIWPTPLNFELWLHFIGAPDSPLAVEMQRILDSGVPFTEDTSELLAAEFLPRSRLSEEIRDAGVALNRELNAVQGAIEKARQVQVQYGETLADAAQTFENSTATTDLSGLVDDLAQATRRIQRHTSILEKRLSSSHTEVNKLREHLEQVRRDAMTDALTNLANRKAFDERLQQMAAHGDATGGSMGLAIIDIDHFKSFNDTWGHQTGDQVLRYVAASLGRIAQEPRFAARYGGEEFAIIFPHEEADVIAEALENLRKDISSRALRRRSTNDELGVVTISAGFAIREQKESTIQWLERADAALYSSKRAGRNRITSADDLGIKETSDAA